MNVLRSEQINEVAQALAKAQGEMKVPEKKRTAVVRMKAEKGGGEYTYQYADLSDIRAAICEALSKNNLAVSQLIDADGCRLNTLLIHSSGQYLGSTYDLPRGLSPQQFGSALTYARRYSLTSLVGVVAEDDDDAERGQVGGERGKKNAKSRPVGVTTPVKPLTSGTARASLPRVPSHLKLDDIIQKISDIYKPIMTLDPQFDFAAEMFARYGARSRKDLSAEEAYDLLGFLESKLESGVGA